ncbi:peptidoglycan editing factor PgeF [Cytophagaceae bacterium DM2B3-1]|uniref:Purine nucleoside phosphorylase n=1 Tax=Xanthocytophaga flava TaxID=3048013 RepID=A0ABT7CHM1_9BACT|nr:peptidoglycan editing factor PgeF [Xanthocytophaga flavus]MDJ1493234.1 peptidoglycan editing factor PgeF [Xanthocytophaga flavus]
MTVPTLSLAYRPEIFTKFPHLIAAQSLRHGGVSPAPFTSLNLGLSSGDERENVLENRNRFFNSLGFQPEDIALSYQVHDDKVLVATQPGNYEGYDAIVTNSPGVFVGVSIADCTPILIYDSSSNAVAAIHAGWKGTMKQIVSKTLQAMTQHFGTNPVNCFAYIGTCISECAFEVDADVADHFTSVYKRWDSEKNKFFVDLKQANFSQLLKAGIPKEQVEVSPFCTVEHNDNYFSYRKEGKKSGRMFVVIGQRTNR